MSETENNQIVNENDNKTPDKKQIEAEEKELMLKTDAENIAVAVEKPPDGDGLVKTALSSTVTEEGREVKPKFIPIGAIKMPGFFTRNSDKEKNKDEEVADDEKEKTEREKPKRHTFQFLHTCPFTQFLHHARNQDTSNTENANNAESSKSRIVDRIRIPLSNMLKKSTSKDPEAALASMETLEDKLEPSNDGMENVKLDNDEVDEGKVATKLPLRERIRQRKFIIDDLVVCGLVILVLLAVLIGVIVGSMAGPPVERPLRDGKYMVSLTGCGRVEGVLEEGVYNFYGIPYAVAPIEEKRFTYAQPLNNLSFCWNDTLLAHKPAPLCTQFLENGTIIGQEDCLTLDIVTPHLRFDSPLSVVVLVGANTLAGGISPLQPSALYARTKEVVFVRPNFRLGAFGFLALDILAKEIYPPTSGNYGLSDLLVALEWIKYNIKYFGGNPESVTLLGHRAGATLVAALTTVKKAQKLYSRVWLSSPSVIYPGEALAQDMSKNEQFKYTSKCNDVACLRRMSSIEIMTAVPDTWLGDTVFTLPALDEPQRSWLVLDGGMLRVHAYEVWDVQQKSKQVAGREVRPMVFSTTKHSALANKTMLKHANWTAEKVKEEVNASVIGALGLTDEVFDHFNKTYAGLVELTSAVRTLCPLVSLARMRLGTTLYVAAGAAKWADVNADVQAILGTLDSETPEQRRFISAMQQLFYYFVWSGRIPGGNTGFKSVEQDVANQQGMPACDMLIKNEIVLRYAHVD